MKKYVKAASRPASEEKMSFKEWLDFTYYPGFSEAASGGLSDEEYYELEDAYRRDMESKSEMKFYWVSGYTATGEQFGTSILAKDTNDLFRKFAEECPDCGIADYGLEN